MFELMASFYAATYCVEVLSANLLEAFGDLSSSNNARQRVAIPDGLSDGNNIWNCVRTLGLKSPEVCSNATKANLNLIGDTYATSFSNVPMFS